MRFRRGQLALAAALVTAAVAASAAWGSELRVLVSSTPNRTLTNRTARTINDIVIHDTEGRFIGSVHVLQRERTDASAHFVVSRSGQIVQLVPVTDVAWHAGNTWWNLHSIGIEHEGWVGRNAYTRAEYRASAELVAYLAHRWTIPIDRKHIIGHDEVPDPYHPGEYGGVDHHTDPGPYWNWGWYMHLVRWYSHHPVLPHFVKRMTIEPSPPVTEHLVALAARMFHHAVAKATTVHAAPAPAHARRAESRKATAPKKLHAAERPVRSTVDRDAVVHGTAYWWSGVTYARRWARHIYKVEFIVDGQVLYTDNTWPYDFHRTIGWDSTTVPNGWHMLVVREFGTHGYRVSKRIPVHVVNAPLHLELTGVVSGGAVDGELAIGVRANGPVQRVALYVDGKPVSRDSSLPLVLHWDTTRFDEGTHRLLVYARGAHGHRAALQLPVIVANDPQFPIALARNWVTDNNIAP